jgi:hypothetical protein
MNKHTASPEPARNRAERYAKVDELHARMTGSAESGQERAASSPSVGSAARPQKEELAVRSAYGLHSIRLERAGRCVGAVAAPRARSASRCRRPGTYRGGEGEALVLRDRPLPTSSPAAFIYSR